MKIRIQGQPEFLLPLTLAEVELMRKVSEKHYDAVCRNASAEEDQFDHNFLTVWRNHLQFNISYPSDDPDYIPHVSATWRQIDTCCKILEPCNLFMLTPIDTLAAKHLSIGFGKALREANYLYAGWAATVDTDE